MERIPGFMASAYNKAAKMAISTYYSQVADEIASGLKLGKALDLGAGPGYLDIEIVKRVPGIRIDGIDLTAELIDIARLNSLEAGVADRLHFEVMNAADLKFEDNSYDMIFSTGMLHSLRKPDTIVKVLKECYRVLKSHGEAWIYDPAKVSSGIDKKVWMTMLTLREKFLYWLFAFWALFDRPHYYTREEVVQIVAATRFKAYQIEDKDDEIRIKLKKL